MRDFVSWGVVRKFGWVNTLFVDRTAITRLLYVNISVYIFRIGPYRLDLVLFTEKNMSIMKNKNSQCSFVS